MRHLYIGGIATDYCVKFTVQDALAQGFAITVLEDAVRGVDIEAGDSERALEKMKKSGASTATLDSIDEELAA